jgi:hypothetical protein
MKPTTLADYFHPDDAEIRRAAAPASATTDDKTTFPG